MAEPQQYSLRWNNYLSQLTHALDKHRLHDEFVDVTLLCDGRKIKAHKVVLSACSSYFNEIFTENPHPHPLIIFKFIEYEDLNSIIKFMYQGEVNVEQESLQSFLKTAELLAVHGLNAEGNDKQKQTAASASDQNKLTKSIPSVASLANQNVDVPKSVQTHQNFPSVSNIRAIATEKRQDQQVAMNTPTATLRATMPMTTCSMESANKKRKLNASFDDGDNNILTSDALGEKTLNESDGMNLGDTMRMDIPEYILGEVSDHPSGSNATQDNIQASGSGGQNVTLIKSEYEILSEPEIEEKYQPLDNPEMTIEMRRLLNPSSSAVQSILDDTASLSNMAFTGNRRSSADFIATEITALVTQINIIMARQEEMTKLVAESNGLLRRNLSLFEVTQTLFPLDSEEKLKKLDDDLATEQRKEMIGAIKRILGGSFRNIERILSKNIVMAFNYDGAKNKKSLKDYENVVNALFEATRQEGTTLDDFVKELRITFRRIKNTTNKDSARHGNRENN